MALYENPALRVLVLVRRLRFFFICPLCPTPMNNSGASFMPLLVGLLVGYGLSSILHNRQDRYAVLDMPRVPFLIRIDQHTGETWVHRTFKERGVQNSYWDRFCTVEDAVRAEQQESTELP